MFVCVCLRVNLSKKNLLNGFFVCLSLATDTQTDRWMSCSSISSSSSTSTSTETKSNESDPGMERGKSKSKEIQSGRHDMKLFVNAIFNNFSNISFRSRFGFPFSLFTCAAFRLLRPPTTRRRLVWLAERREQGRAGQGMVKVGSPLSLHLVLAQCCFSFGFNWSSFSMELHAKRRRHAMTDIDIDVGIVELQRGKSCDCFQMFY